MTTNGQRLTALGLLGLYTKKVGGNRLTSGKKMEHGTIVWAEFEGSPVRKQFYFNKYLPDGTPWLERFMSLEELHKTPKPVLVDSETHIGPWLRRAAEIGRVVFVWPCKPPTKTEAVHRSPETSKTAPPVGGGVYA